MSHELRTRKYYAWSKYRTIGVRTVDRACLFRAFQLTSAFRPHSQLVRLYLLKLAQNLLNELLFQLLLFSAQIFASALSTGSHDRPNNARYKLTWC